MAGKLPVSTRPQRSHFATAPEFLKTLAKTASSKTLTRATAHCASLEERVARCKRARRARRDENKKIAAQRMAMAEGAKG